MKHYVELVNIGERVVQQKIIIITLYTKGKLLVALNTDLKMPPTNKELIEKILIKTKT